ncbi:hypothetical protein ACFCZT_07845 [Streptomyces sp. NPDC056230]|uniref:hypothetical protein n=1 Tax=Streptomyces sp. NPDC056230 TaxID=3345754 RepID=UPI0035E1B467
MARQMVADDDQVYRVVVTSRKRLPNPDYEWRSADPKRQKPHVLSLTETETEFYGPYRTAGAAKTQLKFHCKDHNGDLRPEVLGAGIQKARIVWEEVTQ